MSTTIKRVALVAVAALGLGVVSVAPSQAFTSSDSITLSSATASQLTGETLTAGSASATLNFLASAAGDTMSVSAYLISAPAGNTAYPELSIVETTNATLATTATGANVAATQTFDQVAYVVTTGATKSVTAKFNVYMKAPAKAGTYVIRVASANLPSTNGVGAGSAQTLTITVAANPATDTVAASADVILNAGETISATADDVVTSTKTPAATNNVAAATLKVSLKNAAGKAVTAESFTATIAGPGVLASGAYGSGHNSHALVAQGRSLLVVNGDVVAVFPDGTSGVSTITIASSAGVVLATKKVTFFGAAASISAVVAKPVIGQPAETTKALTVTVLDAAGVSVSNLAGLISVVSSDTTKIATKYTSAVTSTYDATTGTYSVGVTGVAAGTANLTVSTKASATDTDGIDAKAAVAVRVGSYVPASVKVTTDKSSYAPGEKGSVLVQLLDKDGLEVVSGESYTAIFTADGIVSSYALQNSTLPTTAVNVYAAGGKAYTFYAPVTEGDVKFSWTTGSTASGDKTGLATANQATDGSVVISVSSVATSAAIDAAQEASAAAQDATDAAISATEAAEEASALAQEAVTAVATLSAQVSKLITALKAQITTLSNLVAKIAKKVKA